MRLRRLPAPVRNASRLVTLAFGGSLIPVDLGLLIGSVRFGDTDVFVEFAVLLWKLCGIAVVVFQSRVRTNLNLSVTGSAKVYKIDVPVSWTASFYRQLLRLLTEEEVS